jgi:PHP family Zn ribbon phosphoesterase
MLKDKKTQARVILSTEISNIYKQDGKVRKIHTLIVMPTLKDAERFSKLLSEKGNTAADGRPIFGFSVRDLVKYTFDITPDAMAHISAGQYHADIEFRRPFAFENRQGSQCV